MSKESSTTKHRSIARTEKVKETTFQGTDIKKITSSAETFKYVTYRILSLQKKFPYSYTVNDEVYARLIYAKSFVIILTYATYSKVYLISLICFISNILVLNQKVYY